MVTIQYFQIWDSPNLPMQLFKDIGDQYARTEIEEIGCCFATENNRKSQIEKIKSIAEFTFH